MASIPEQLKAYRPSATVLEAEVARGQRTAHANGGAPAAGIGRIMQQKRDMHDSAIQVNTAPAQLSARATHMIARSALAFY